jgi:D-glycerate 3-kinase
MGFQPLGQAEISRRYDQALRTSEQPGPTRPVFLSHSLESLIQVDEYLKVASEVLYPTFTVLIRPQSYSYVYEWRRQQEHQMISARGAGMTDGEVDAFVARYMPGYELWAEPTNITEGGEVEMGWEGNVLTLLYGKDREVISVEES